LLDGVTPEQQGLPTATVITDVFVRTAEAYLTYPNYLVDLGPKAQSDIYQKSSVAMRDA
jgi:hypothetical protein